jgi:hypothetical protein
MDRILSLSRCNPLARGEFFKIRLRFTPDASSWSDIAWWTCADAPDSAAVIVPTPGSDRLSAAQYPLS